LSNRPFFSCPSFLLHDLTFFFRTNRMMNLGLGKRKRYVRKLRPVAPTPNWENRWQRDQVAWAPQHTRPRHIKDRDPALSPLIPRRPGFVARDPNVARPPAGIWWDANRRHQTTDFFGAMDDFKRHRSMVINYVSPLFPRNLSTAWTSSVEEEDTEESTGGDCDAGDWDAEETVGEVKASEPRWKMSLRNRRLGEEFAAAADEAGADKAATGKAAVEVSHQSAWRRPVFGSMWVRHPEHGLVRRSARIAARNNQP